MYKPYLVARINSHADREYSKHLGKILDYDYMGSSEFEWGAIPRSRARMRLGIMNAQLKNQGSNMVIVEAPKHLVATNGAYTGCLPYALLSTETVERFPDLWEQFELLTKGECRLKEWSGIDFQYSNRFGPLAYDAWHDIENDIFFAYSKSLLEAIHALLGLPLSDEKCDRISFEFRVGDEVSVVFAQPSSNLEKKDQADRWITVTGRLFGIGDMAFLRTDDPRVKRKKICVPWHMVLTRPAGWLPEHDVEKLQRIAGAGH